MVILNSVVLFLLLFTCGSVDCNSSGGSPLLPPYTCTTTVCRPGLSTPDQRNNQTNMRSGSPGKQGFPGVRGPKGEKGDPCQCNATSEREFDDLETRIRTLESQNRRLIALNSIGSPTNPAKSCHHLKQEVNSSGIYTIQYTEHSPAIKVFCDMQHAGGGWTLVASIHENNIEGKCTSGDLWSSDQGNTKESYQGNGNWENFNSFGTPQSATCADYKSEAYYSLPATDVMIWHVPNGVKIYEAHNYASLMYHTNTSFLADYGGTLQSVFKNHYHMQKISKEYKASTSVDEVISLLNRSATNIRNLVPQFHSYVYDGGDNNINDGGNDMYDAGNRVYYQINDNEEVSVAYNEQYRNATYAVYVFSSTSHPFNLLVWIGDGKDSVNSFALKVTGGSGADKTGAYRTLSGTIRSGSFVLAYQAFNVYGAGDPSISKVFYFIKSTQNWRSVAPSFTRSPWSSGTDPLSHGVLLDRNPQRVMVGYTLLSRTNAVEVTSGQIESVLRKILTIITENREVVCNRLDKSLVEPVTYIKGNDQVIINGIPTSSRSDVTPGFLQFRAYNSDGIPNALCPGVRTTSCTSQSICVGGINTMSDDAKSCGDFAGWGNTQSGSLQGSKPTSAGKSLNDINSSILIFTRKQE